MPQSQLAGNLPGLRVLVVTPHANSPHSMVFVKNTVRSIEMAGIEVRLYELTSRTNPGVLVSDALRFRRLLAEFRPHIVHAQYGSVTGFFCAVLSSVPVVITYCGSDLNPCPATFWPRSLIGRTLSHLAALPARALICVSEELRSRLLWGRSRAVVLPSGVDLRVFRPKPQEAARRSLGWPLAEPVVLFNAGTSPVVKRLDAAEKAFTLVRSRLPEATLHVLRGEVNHTTVAEVMNASDCLLMLSDFEGSPNVVKEAVAVGLPVVSVPVGDVRVILDGVEPSCIVGRDLQEIADAVVGILQEQRRSNGPSVATRFCVDAHSPELVRVYQAALGQNPDAQPCCSGAADTNAHLADNHR